MKYLRAYFLRNTEVRKQIEDEAIGVTYNRLASGKRETDLADSIARGFITTYKASFFGLVFIVLGFTLQLAGQLWTR